MIMLTIYNWILIQYYKTATICAVLVFTYAETNFTSPEEIIRVRFSIRRVSSLLWVNLDLHFVFFLLFPFSLYCSVLQFCIGKELSGTKLK